MSPLYQPSVGAPDSDVGVPLGAILLWSGTIATIPANFALCDGTANSPGPDLRDKFVVGATSDNVGVANTNVTGALTQTGGAATHTHTATDSAVDAHHLDTNVAISAHANAAVSAHTLSTNVAVTASHATVASMASGTTRVGTPTTTVAVGVTQPVINNHTITQPDAHAITQPVVGAHAITQPTISTDSGLPPYFALAYIQRIT